MQTVAASNTQDLYDQHTNLWVRSSPTILSDYTARPRVLQRIGDVRGLSVLDLGCGEGYVARELARAGAERIVGMDLSSKMVQAAQEQNKEDLYPISYSVEDLRQWSEPKSEYDRAVAVFLFNYLNVQDSIEVLTKTHRALRSGAELILTLPHPSLPWLRPQQAPFYFNRPGVSYFDARDHELAGRIWQRNGDSVPVQCFHKTMEDIFKMITKSGFQLIGFEELYVTSEHIELDHAFFSPLRGTPLHVLVHAKVEK